jgi:SagB-type dehydrogenase family enzyme
MNSDEPYPYHPQLDRTTFPEWRDQMLAFESEASAIEPRSYPGYPGYPRWPLARVGTRAWPPLDQVLLQRRSATRLSTAMPSRRVLSRILRFAHGVNANRARGPTPSAGGLQGLELYLAAFETSWLPSGLYHYNRVGNHLSQIRAQASRANWRETVPSLETLDGGAVVFVLVGDVARVSAKYGALSHRFLLMEAGHLAQNLCLLATSVGFCAVPLGGFFERAVSRSFMLPDGDFVLGLLLCGKPESTAARDGRGEDRK